MECNICFEKKNEYKTCKNKKCDKLICNDCIEKSISSIYIYINVLFVELIMTFVVALFVII